MISRAPRMMLTLAGTVLIAVSPAGADGPLRLPPDDPPPSLAALAPLQDALAVTVSRDAVLAAAALPNPEKSKSSLVRIAAGNAPVRDVDVRGTLRSLRFAPGGRTLFAIAHRPWKNEDVQESWLVLIDVETLKVTRSVSLPATARGLDVWVKGGALLVACRDEVRTILLPQVRSGPLFWIGGNNHAVASLPGGDFALVGQDAEILLVNLSDPQGREPLPVRDRVPTKAAVVNLATSPDGNAALARLEDGAVLEITVDPFGVEESGNASLIAWLGRPAPPRPPPAAVVPAAASGPDADTAASPTETALSAAKDLPPTEAAPPALEPDAPTPMAEPEPELAESPGPESAPPARNPDRGELEGRLTGAAVSEGVAVVLLGPENITREAKRVIPRADGSWVAVDLAPGRYRVVLDGGGGRVLASDPAFRQSRVVVGIRVEVPPIEVLRAIDR